jgi:hypothetical protein
MEYGVPFLFHVKKKNDVGASGGGGGSARRSCNFPVA